MSIETQREAARQALNEAECACVRLRSAQVWMLAFTDPATRHVSSALWDAERALQAPLKALRSFVIRVHQEGDL